MLSSLFDELIEWRKWWECAIIGRMRSGYDYMSFIYYYACFFGQKVQCLRKKLCPFFTIKAKSIPESIIMLAFSWICYSCINILQDFLSVSYLLWSSVNLVLNFSMMHLPLHNLEFNTLLVIIRGQFLWCGSHIFKLFFSNKGKKISLLYLYETQ